MRHKILRSKRKKRSRSKRKIMRRKTLRGGFFSDANYFLQKGISFLSVDPVPPIGNSSIPIPPFPYFQNK